MAREVVITGIGVMLPNCDHREVLWRQLATGESQLAFEPDPAGSGRPVAIGRVRGLDPARHLRDVPERHRSHYSAELQYYVASTLAARDDARLHLDHEDPERVGLFDGTSRAAIEFWYERARDEGRSGRGPEYTRRDLLSGLPGQSVGVAASLLGVQGPTYVFSGTCSAGAIAIGHAFREVRDGEIDIAFAGGHDAALIGPLFAMYSEAQLLSTEHDDARRAVRPWEGTSANAFGEGAVTLVLEEREHAIARGATVLARVAGFRSGNHGEHPMSVDPSGDRLARVVGALLERAEIDPKKVCFVVGHGNGVKVSDESEERAMRLVFGDDAARIPLVSTKPIYGHLLGASSALNVAAAALMLRHSFIVPTINADEDRPSRGVNHQPNHGLQSDCHVGVCTSFGMGGHNTAVLLAKEPVEASR